MVESIFHQTAADVYQYVLTHKEQYPEVRITADHDEFIAVQAVNGIIVFPKKWALMEVKQKYIDVPDTFNSETFKQALNRSGFEVDADKNFTASTAQVFLTELYERVDGEEQHK
ncbi:hypothetical protein [Paenibacillus sp. USHLN196]|uniref:hypothetical protein n=1 Tax=Paenibacillus sp. USHLN196 TaxID=3081291 RepID=UPI0030179E16